MHVSGQTLACAGPAIVHALELSSLDDRFGRHRSSCTRSLVLWTLHAYCSALNRLALVLDLCLPSLQPPGRIQEL